MGYMQRDMEDIAWPRGDTKFLVECWKNVSRVSALKFSVYLTCEILSWTREEKLICISNQPLIILFTKYVTLILQRHFCLTQHWLNYKKGQQVFLAQSFLFTLYPLGPFSHVHGSVHSRDNYLNILLTTKSCLNSHFKIGRHCHSFMALNRVSDRSTGDWHKKMA